MVVEMFDEIILRIFISSCFLIIGGNSVTELASYTGQDEINLKTQFECDKWTFNNEAAQMPKTADENSTGVYKCGDKIVLVFVHAPLEMGFYPNNFRLKENVSMECHVYFWPGEFNLMKTKMTISDDKDKVLITNGNAIKSATNRMHLVSKSPNFLVTHEGNYSGRCDWEIVITHGGKEYTDKLTSFVTAYPEYPVKNVKPSRTKTTIYEPIYCLAEGNPSPFFFDWSCDEGRHGKHWNSHENQLHILRSGIYNCKCITSNEGAGGVRSSYWEGEIEVVKLTDGTTATITPESMEESVNKPAGSTGSTLFHDVITNSCFVAMVIAMRV